MSAKMILSINTTTERFLPEVALGGTVESLSLPQQTQSKDAHAWQKHQVTLVEMQAIKEDCGDS